MKNLLIASIMSAVSFSVVAAEGPYSGQPYEHPKNTNERVSNVEYHTYRNSYHIGVHDKQIGELRETKVDKTEFYEDQQRQDKHINAVQDAAQKANVKADNNSVRLNKSESAIRETNAQLEVTDKRSINNAVRLDGVEAHNGRQHASIDALNKQADTINQTLSNYGDVLGNHQQQLDALQSLGGQALSEAQAARREAREAKSYVAVALAVAAHQFNTDPQAGFQVALSGATIGGYQAVAFGAGGAINEKWFVNAAVSTSRGNTGGAVSATYSFGR